MIERQNKVHLRQLNLWAEVLQQVHVHAALSVNLRQRDMFDDLDGGALPPIEPYKLITFDPLVEFQIDSGVPESAWLPSDDSPNINENDDSAQGRLFAT